MCDVDISPSRVASHGGAVRWGGLNGTLSLVLRRDKEHDGVPQRSAALQMEITTHP